jgi:hypothetical protein
MAKTSVKQSSESPKSSLFADRVLRLPILPAARKEYLQIMALKYLPEKETQGESRLSEVRREKTKREPLPKGDIKTRFSFNKAQAFFDGQDLGLPTGAETKAVDILKKLVKSFGQVVQYGKLDKTIDPKSDSASDVLRQKVFAINSALKKNKVPCRIHSRKWTGYVLSPSGSHS